MSESIARKRPTLNELPDATGHFGRFGGCYVPETLMPALEELAAEYRQIRHDPRFQQQLEQLFHQYVGRPTPLYEARSLAEALGGRLRLWLKREDLAHTGAHKINNTLGQVLMAQRMGKRRVIAETGAGQHGVATATAAALLGLDCEIYMGEEDVRRQELNVFRMRLLGTRVIPVRAGSRTLKDAINEAMRDWMASVDHTHYVFGTCAGPHPFPMMVRDFQSVIGREARWQFDRQVGGLPDLLIACIGGGSNSLGLFAPFYDEDAVRFVGVEAEGEGLLSGRHACSIHQRQVGVFHGSKSFVLQTGEGQITPAHSISAGLDYPGVGPEHSFYAEIGRAQYISATDDEALQATRLLCRTEGLIPALESAHALAGLHKIAPDLPEGANVILNLSGRGDKDVYSMRDAMGDLE